MTENPLAVKTIYKKQYLPSFQNSASEGIYFIYQTASNYHMILAKYLSALGNPI